ncbi:MAG: hypothetical protein LBN21_00770, partial [Treponema sp.]|nr:hypothetical protein [Treponema sp.]
KQRVFDLLEDEALYRRKVAEAKSHAQDWTIDTMAAKLEGIYREVISVYPLKPHPKFRRSFLPPWGTAVR